MGYFKTPGDAIKTIASGAIIPGASDAVNKFVDSASGETSKKQDEKIAALEAEVAAGRKTKAEAEMEAKAPAMKKGGKVSSASKRADGCCIRGKTRA
jgi:hypothetical protein